MIDTVFGIKVRMSGLSINRYRPIIGRLLDADNRSLPYRCISNISTIRSPVCHSRSKFLL